MTEVMINKMEKVDSLALINTVEGIAEVASPIETLQAVSAAATTYKDAKSHTSLASITDSLLDVEVSPPPHYGNRCLPEYLGWEGVP